MAFAAQWLAYAIPCRRFAPALADNDARFGADVDLYSFIVEDSNLLLLTGLPARAKRLPPSQSALSSGAATIYRKRRSGGDTSRHPARSGNVCADSGLRWRITLRLSAGLLRSPRAQKVNA